MILLIQVLYLKKIETTRRLAKCDGYFGEHNITMKKMRRELF
jgi:hypothetical protein